MTPWNADADDDTDPDAIKARIHRLMAEHAAILPRGYNTTRERHQLHASWDSAYEDWLVMTGRDTYDSPPTNSDDIPVA